MRRIIAATLRVLFGAVLAIALLLLGAAEVWPLTVVATAVAAVAFASAVICGEPAATRPIFRVTVVATILAALAVLLQAVPVGEPFAHPVWREAAEILGPLPGTASLSPSTTVFSVLWLVTPLLAFLAALALFDDDRRASTLFAGLAWSGGLVAALSLAQFAFFPKTLVFAEKANYVDSLTGPFVNRNTAATYFGVTSLLLFALFYRQVRSASGPLFGSRFQAFAGAAADGRWRPFTTAVLLVMTLCALFLTKSRGGVGSTVAAYLVLVPLLLSSSGQRRRNRQEGARRWVRSVVGVVAVLVIGLVFAGRAAYRAEQQGLSDERFCIYDGLVSAILSRPFTGSGFGVFSDAFAPFRDAECGIYLIWYRAHNGYLELAVGLGLPFLAAILIAAVALALVLARGVRERRKGRYGPAATLAAIILVALHAAVDFSLQVPGFALVAAAVLASGVTVAARTHCPAGLNRRT